MSVQARPLAEKFWARVEKTDGCWLWTGALKETGYGAIGHKGRTLRAPRVAWALAKGPIPEGLWVLHKCDNRRCVRPDHLFLGTRRDNIDDAIQKGRHPKPPLHAGADCHLTKLSPDQVEKIRELLRLGLPHRSIGDRFGVSKSAIGNIARGRTWRAA